MAPFRLRSSVPTNSQFVAGAQVIPLPLAGGGDSLGGATINARALPKKTLISGSFKLHLVAIAWGPPFNDVVARL